MSGARRLWFAKTWWSFPLFLLIQVGAMFNGERIGDSLVPMWVEDWSYMLSKWNGRTLLLSPVAAATVALVILRSSALMYRSRSER